MINKIEQLVSKIRNLKSKKKLLIIGIDGRGGTGKTTLALLLKQKIKEIMVITTDDFWNDEIKKIDERLLEEQVLLPISKSLPGSYLEYRGDLKRKVRRIVKPEGILIIEGVYSIHSSIEKYYDFKIWINSELATVDHRIDKRDNGKNSSWDEVHRPNETNYIKNDDPKGRADMIISNDLNQKDIPSLNELWNSFK